jgi:hypothetical protein
MDIPNVNARDRIIPAGKVLLTEGKVPREDMAQETTLATRMAWEARREVRLVARVAGWVPAGSTLRWDNGAFGVLWEIDGSRHGRWHKTYEEARAHFDRLPA